MKQLFSIFCLVIVSFCGVAFGVLDPGAPLSDPNYEINLYEPIEGTGEFSVTMLETFVQPGFVVLMEPLGDWQNLHPVFSQELDYWSDIVEYYTPDGATQSYADFWSDVEGQPFPSDLVARVLAGPTVYIPEWGDPSNPLEPPINYVPVGASGCTYTYHIWSDIPEPTTMCLFGLGALGLLRKRRA
jgi:hypothetical protein